MKLCHRFHFEIDILFDINYQLNSIYDEQSMAYEEFLVVIFTKCRNIQLRTVGQFYARLFIFKCTKSKEFHGKGYFGRGGFKQ